MTTQLRQLRTELSADTSDYVRALSEAERAAEALGQASADLGRRVEETDKKSTKSAAGFSALRRSIDPMAAANDRLTKGLKTLADAMAVGRIDDQEHARLKLLLVERYDLAGQAATRAARAQVDAAKAAQASAAAEQAGLQRLRGRYDEAYGAAEKYNTALAELATLQRAGALAGQSLAEAQAKVERELNPVNQAIAKQEAALKASATAAQAQASAMEALRGKYDSGFAAAMKYNTALREVMELERSGALAGQSLADAKEKIERELNPLNLALEKERQQITQLLGQLDPTRTATARLAEGEALLGKALAAGTISGTEHARMLRLLRTQAGDTSHGIELAGHQVTNLSFQLQDAAVQLQMGTNPFTILMQQGPQAVGAVGGVSNAAKLLGTAMRAVVSPTGLAVAGLVALGAAAAVVASRVAQINAEMRKTTEVLRALNPTSGLSAEQVRGASFAIANQRGVSRADASAGLDASIRNRNIGGAMAVQIAGVGQDLAAVLGIDPAQAAAKLAEAFSKGAAGIRDLDKELGFLSAEQLRSIRLMEEHGNRAGALALAMQALEGRVGGAAARMKSDWELAWEEMGKTFDSVMEKIAKSEWWQQLAQATQSAARGWREIFGTDTDVSADIVAANKQLVAAVDALKKLEAARASGSGMITDRMIEQQAARVAALNKQVDDLIEKQRAQAETMAPGGGPIAAPPPAPGMTGDEIKRIGELREALEKEKGAMAGSTAERSIRVAGIQAEIAALEGGATSFAAHEQRLIAEQRARLALNVASDDQLRALALETKQLMELSDAYQISKDAVTGQLAMNQAETAAVNGQTQAQKVLYQALLERAAAQALVAGSQQLQALRDEVRENKALAGAALESAAAEEEVARQNKVRLFSEQVLTAAIKTGRQDMIDAAEVEVRKYDQLTKAALEANRARQFNVAVRSQRESLELQQKEFELISATPEVRAREMAIIEATNRLKAMGKDITTAEGQEYIRNAGILAEQATRLGEIQRITTEATDNIVEAFGAMAEGGKDAFQSLKDFAMRVLKEIAAQAVIRPIITPIVTAAVNGMAGMSGGASAPIGASGAGGSAGSMMSTAGSVGQMANMAGLTGPGTAIGSMMGTTLIGGTTTGAITQSGSLAAAYSAPGTIAGSAGGLTVGSAVGSFAGGAAVGGMIGSLVGNATQSKAIGAGTGALTGAAAGFMIGGPVGAAIGAVGGALMAALGTSGKPSNKEGNASYDMATGRTVVGGQTGDKFSQENRDAASGAAKAYGTIGGMMGGLSDRRVSGGIRVVMGDRDGMSASFNGAKVDFKKRNDDAMRDMTKWFVDQFAAQLGTSLPGDVRTALQRIDWKDVETALADLNFAGTFRDSLKALRGDFGLTDEAAKAAKEEVGTLTDNIIKFKAQTQRLGLDTAAAADATRSYVEGLLGLRQVAAPMNATEEAVAVLRVRFDAMAPLLREVGINANEAARGLQRAIAALRDDFVKGLDREFNELRGAGWINQIDDTFAALADRMKSAAALGGGSFEALRNNHFAIKNILNDLSDDQLTEAAQRYGGDITILADAIKAARVVVAEAAPAVAAAVLDVAGFLKTLEKEANESSGRQWANQIADQFSHMSEQMEIAAKAGMGADIVLANNHRMIVNILNSLTDAQLADASASFGGNIAIIADSIRQARATLGEAAPAIQQALFDVAGWLRDMGREQLQLSNRGYLNSISDQFGKLSEQMAIAERVGVGSADALLNNHLAMTRILEDLTDVQLRDAAARFGGGIAIIAESLIAGRVATEAATAAQQAATKAQEDATRTAEEAAAKSLAAANDRVERARDSVQRAYQKEIDAQQALADAAKATGDNMRRFAGSFRDLKQSLLTSDLSPLSPEARYNEARAQFQDVAGKAAAGDETAMGQLEGVAQTFLQQSRAYYASSATYAQDFASVQDALSKAEAAASAQASAADAQLAQAQAQTGLLQSQLDAINGTTAAVMTIPAAIAELTSALVGQAAAGGGGSGAGSGTVGGIDVIGAAYQQFLGRAPDAGGYANWQGQLSAGGTLAGAVGGIANSDEAFIRGLYTSVLGRAPDAGGLTHWGNLLHSGMTRTEVEGLIRSSGEAQAANQAYVSQLYQTLLGREPDASGLATWTGAMQQGMSRAEVERLIKATPEGKARGYEAGGVVSNGRWNQDSVTAMLAGGEYVTRAPSVNSGTLATLSHINRTGAVPANDTGDIRALRDETRRQTAALQEGFLQLIKLTGQQTADISDLRAAQRRKAAS
jgi:hypothetical protein